MSKRSHTMDVFRAVALLLVLVYHSWVLTGCLPFRYDSFSLIVSLGGEIGVTAFFALSGYGIYYSIASQERNGGFHFWSYMRRRCLRIVPQYYISILFAVVFLYGGAYFSLGDGIKSIVTHLLFVHNLFPECHGAINGALWTMGVTFQFYIVAYPLYKGVKKGGIFFAASCILVTITAKCIMYAYVLPGCNMDHNLEFFSGRQLLTSLDNFTAGMYVAYIVEKKECKNKRNYSYLGGVILGCVLIYLICWIGRKNGIHTNNISGYIWHSFLALGLGIVMLFCSLIRSNPDNRIVKAILLLAKYEYGIYIWHILIINNLIVNSGIVQAILNSKWPKMVYLVFAVIAVFVGCLLSQMTDAYMDERRKRERYECKNKVSETQESH